MKEAPWTVWSLVLVCGAAACVERPAPSGWTAGDGAIPGVNTCKAVMCEVDADCPGSIYRGGCDTTNNACVMCKVNAHCDSKIYKGGCNATTKMCGMCQTDAHCQISGVMIMTGKCDPGTGFCIRCNVDGDCTKFTGSTYKACSPQKTCVMCISNSDCTNKATCVKGVCAKDVQCVQDADCTSPLTCHTASGLCTCASAVDCSTAYGTYPINIKKWLCK